MLRWSLFPGPFPNYSSGGHGNAGMLGLEGKFLALNESHVILFFSCFPANPKLDGRCAGQDTHQHTSMARYFTGTRPMNMIRKQVASNKTAVDKIG
jgi:hypothetical protein